MADLTYYNDLAESITSSGAPLDTTYLSQETRDLIHNLQIPGYYYRQRKQQEAAAEERRRREYWEEEWGDGLKRGVFEFVNTPVQTTLELMDAFTPEYDTDFEQRLRSVHETAYRYRPEDTTFAEKTSTVTGQILGSFLVVFAVGVSIVLFCRIFKPLKDKKWVVYVATMFTPVVVIINMLKEGRLTGATFISIVFAGAITIFLILKLFYTSASKKVSEVKTVPPSGIKCIPENVEYVCPECGVIHIVPGNVEIVNCCGHCFSTKEYKK